MNGRLRPPGRFHRPDDSVFWFAEISSGVKEKPTYATITVDTSEDIKWLHGRKPAVLADSESTQWLVKDTSREATQTMLHSAPVGRFKAYQVSKIVNSPRNDGDALIRPVDPC